MVGFHLEWIDLDRDRAAGTGAMMVTVRHSNASGDPGNVVYTLYNSTNVGTGLRKFMAPAGAYLSRNTGYFVHITYSGGVTLPRWNIAESSNEDSGAQSGWSIEDTHTALDDGNWTDAASLFKCGSWG